MTSSATEPADPSGQSSPPSPTSTPIYDQLWEQWPQLMQPLPIEWNTNPPSPPPATVTGDDLADDE